MSNVCFHEISNQKTKKYLTYTIIKEVDGTPEQFWDYFEFIKLNDIFPAQGKLPGIKSTSSFTDWHTPGKSRTIYFTTGDTAKEEILECTVPNHFKYKVFDSTLPIKHFAKYIIGEWFIKKSKNITVLKWTYTIIHKSWLHKLLIIGFFKNSLIPYMESSISLVKTKYEDTKKIRINKERIK